MSAHSPPDLDTLPASALVAPRDIIATLNISRTAFNDLLRAGALPARVKLPKRVARWRAGDIREWLAAL